MAKSDWEVKIHVKGVGDTFRQSGVVGELESMGNAIANEATALTNEHYPDNGFELSHFGVERYTTTHGNVGFSVYPRTPLAKRAQAEHSVLTQAMDAGRG